MMYKGEGQVQTRGNYLQHLAIGIKLLGGAGLLSIEFLFENGERRARGGVEHV